MAHLLPLVIAMNRVNIKMKVLPEKRKEFMQTINLLLDPIRAESGCHSCEFCQSATDENELCLLESWDSQESFEGHRNSSVFKVLQGAMTLLKEPVEMTIATVLQTTGIEEIMRLPSTQA
jgi:quinol monooxygenase YgiN